MSHIKVRSIYSKLKTMGWTRADLIEYIINIEDKLGENNISVEPTKIDLSKFTLEDAVKEQKIVEYKPDQGKLTKAHDLAAIYMINQKRQRRIYQLEKARAFFVTSDKKLANYNYCEWNHVGQGTISEVLPDSVATNILWLKKPSAIDSISIEAIISMYSRGLFVDDVIWSRFVLILRNLRLKGNIDDKDVALLLYDSRMQDELQKARTGDMSDNWVIERIENVRKKANIEIQEKIELVEVGASREIDKAYKTLFNTIEEIKQGIKNRASKSARNIVNTLTFFLIVGVILLFWKIAPLYQANWGKIEPYKDMLGFVFVIVLALSGLQIDIKSLRERFQNWLFSLIYKKKLRESEVEKINKRISELES